MAAPAVIAGSGSDVAETPAAEHSQATAALRPYEAEYVARSRGLSSTAIRTLEQLDPQGVPTYRLVQQLDVSVLGATLISLTETSHFAISDNQIIPGAYRYEQGGISRREEHIAFDWNEGEAQVTTRDGEQEYPLEPGVLDQLAFTAQLSLDVQRTRLRGTGRTDFRYDIIEDNGIEEELYRIRGEELLETRFGELQTVRIERIREPDSPRTTTIWLAMEHNYILARLLQTEEGESDTELSLSALQWTGNGSNGGHGSGR